MTMLKIWCEACKGLGSVRRGSGEFTEACFLCVGKGYREFPAYDDTCPKKPEYTIDDAEVDAKVLATVSGTGLKQTDAICYEIVNRLHRFYCGGTNDKR